jgi:peptide/nickel transport system permease protein
VVRYIARRLLGLIPVLIGVSVVVFSLSRLLPGDVTSGMLLEGQTDPQYSLELRHYLGIDRSWPAQYWDWSRHVLMGDFGRSFVSHKPVSEEIRARLPSTLELASAALLLSLLIAIPLGVLAAVRRNSWLAC